jgi:hypothetical protein
LLILILWVLYIVTLGIKTTYCYIIGYGNYRVNIALPRLRLYLIFTPILASRLPARARKRYQTDLQPELFPDVFIDNYREEGCRAMVHRVFLFTILLFILSTPCIKARQDDSPVLRGPYLGQKSPGKTPKIFAPGVISTDSANEFGISFAPDGKEILFTRRIEGVVGNRIYYMKCENGTWQSPRPSPFSDGNTELEPNFTPDGKSIFFNSWRPLPESAKTGNEMNVWLVRKETGVWKVSGVLGPPVSDLNPVYVTQTRDSTIYFTGNVNRGIYRAECESGEYRKWERLPEEINNRYWAGHPFVDPDERYILFDSNVDSLGTKNLFISFRMEPGIWSPSVNVNEHLGFSNHAGQPHVTFDGQFLFFRSKGDVYWVNASFLKDLRPKQ